PPPQRTPTQTLPSRREGFAGASPGGRAAKRYVVHIVLLPERQALSKKHPPGVLFVKALKINEKNQMYDVPCSKKFDS
ncbi:MAG TPA: hypothetical protein PL119_03165, partial [Bacteroidales bacterium]|nr:hypothetical protein [Bacteroidales bacterium]